MDPEKIIIEGNDENTACTQPQHSTSKCTGITILGRGCERNATHGTHCFQHHNARFRECKPDDCPVCADSLANERHALSCGHWVHLECVINSAKEICPVCRATLNLSKRAKRQIAQKARQRNMEIIREQEQALIEEYYSGHGDEIYEQIYVIVAMLVDDPDQITNEIMNQYFPTF